MDQTTFDCRFGRRPKQEVDVPRLLGRALHSRYVRPFTSKREFLQTLCSFVPIVGWLRGYSVKKDLLGDIIGGLIVGIMHIPQGIAYSSLAGVDAVIGLYTSFFPPLTYMLFGTSRHVSVGSFAVVALMAGNTVTKLSCSDALQNGGNCTSMYTPIEVASTLTFTIGLIQMFVGALGLSFMTTYFSDGLVAGFTTGASFHVLVTQLKDVLGIYGDAKRTEWGQLIMKIGDIFARIAETNYVTLSLSIVVMAILIVGKYFVNPFVQKKLKSPVPVPFELIVVIGGTLVSYFMELEEKYGVKAVGNIPTGLPRPFLPKFSLLADVFPEAVSIAVVVLAIQVSLAKMFAKKFKYSIDTTQEFYGTGLMSMISGFFPVYPPSPSLSRTLVNVAAGTRTQLAAVFSSALILGLCLFAGKYLKTLPVCILAAIVIVALFGMFEKLGQVKQLWRVSKVDFAIWLISFTGTVSLDVVAGLVLALSFALFTTVLRSQCANLTYLTEATESIYCDVDRYSGVEGMEDTKVVRFDAPLIFTNAERFQKAVVAVAERQEEEEETDSDLSMLVSLDEKPSPASGVVIDCSPFIYIDIMGVEALKTLYEELKDRRIRLLLAAAPDAVRDIVEKCDKEKVIPDSAFYPTVQDAVASLNGRF